MQIGGAAKKHFLNVGVIDTDKPLAAYNIGVRAVCEWQIDVKLVNVN